MKQIKILLVLVLFGFISTTKAQKTIQVNNVTAASFYNVSYTIEFGNNWTDIANNGCYSIDFKIKNLVVNSFKPRNKTYSGNDLAINHPNYNGGVSFPFQVSDNDATNTIRPEFKAESNNEAHTLTIWSTPGTLTNCPKAAAEDISQYKPSQLSITHIKTNWNIWSLQTEFGVSLGKLLSDLARFKEEQGNNKNNNNNTSSTSKKESTGGGNGYEADDNSSNTTTYQESEAERRDRLDRENAQRIRQETQDNIDRVNNATDEAQKQLNKWHQREVDKIVAEDAEKERIRQNEKNQKEKYLIEKIQNSFTRYEKLKKDGDFWEAKETLSKISRYNSDLFNVYYRSSEYIEAVDNKLENNKLEIEYLIKTEVENERENERIKISKEYEQQKLELEKRKKEFIDISYNNELPPKIEFLTKEFNFGSFDYDPNGVKRVFEYKNVGGQALIITKINASCGCTVPKFSSEPIMPGEIGKIEVIYNPKDRNFYHKFDKKIYVYSNSVEPKLIISVKGIVNEKK